MIVMKKEKYIRPLCKVLVLEALCQLAVNNSIGDTRQMSKEHSFTLEEETTTGWENE
jgi:hypothetical protein